MSMLSELGHECMGCRMCGKESAHITWPLLGYFPSGAKILLIGQNPAEPKIRTERDEFNALYKNNFDTTDPISYLGWYAQWLQKSSMVSSLEVFFGQGWFESGHIAITNAVRCRTRNNDRPTDIMIENCYRFSSPITEQYDHWIVMGGVARKQLRLGETTKAPKILHFLEQDRYVLYMNHYAWRPPFGKDRSKEIKACKRFIEHAIDGRSFSG